EQIDEETDVISVQNGELRLVLLDVRMVRQDMERIADAARRIDRIAELGRELECRHARDVRLPREDLQIQHELDVLLDVLGYARRAVRNVEIVGRARAGL